MAAFPLDKFREHLKKKEQDSVDNTASSVEEKVEETTKLPVEEKEEIIEISEKDEFNNLNLSKDDLLEIKKIALSDLLEQDISVSELVDLVLLSKTGKTIKEKNKDGLLIREYIDRDGKITRHGKLYLEFDETRNRLKNLLK